MCSFRFPIAGELSRLYQLPVFPSDTDSASAVPVDAVDYFLVHRGAQHHFDHVHRMLVGDAHAVDKFGLDIEPLEQLADLWASAMHHNGVHSHQLHQYHVAGKALLQLGVRHGVAAEFNDEGFPREPLDIGQ